ncbi:hypothetical protein GOV14_06505 [Candidatus Pacearchaeota archaeon]|nr:hypothetical protein [Candidatus Pacearchaeota archaeon]
MSFKPLQQFHDLIDEISVTQAYLQKKIIRSNELAKRIPNNHKRRGKLAKIVIESTLQINQLEKAKQQTIYKKHYIEKSTTYN